MLCYEKRLLDRDEKVISLIFLDILTTNVGITRIFLRVCSCSLPVSLPADKETLETTEIGVTTDCLHDAI